MHGADAVARILKLEGVDYLFSYPNHPLIDAAARVGIRPIIARGEKTLINIADGYTRATNARKPAVIVVQAGPGIENAFGGLAQAAADSIPLLVIPPARTSIGWASHRNSIRCPSTATSASGPAALTSRSAFPS